MDLTETPTTFIVDTIYDIAASLFSAALATYGGALVHPYQRPSLFALYESSISEFIDDLKDDAEEERVDFYEAISVMSWAIYRLWAKEVVDNNHPLTCIDELPKDIAISLFMENLNCEEGKRLLARIDGIKRA